MQQTEHLDLALEAIERVRTDGAHLHSITNTVAQNFTANVLLACGISVSMTINPDEIADFASFAGAFHINLGTLDQERIAACLMAVRTCSQDGKPLLLDPVKVDISKRRLSFARELLPQMSVIRANSAENVALDLGQSQACLVVTGKTDVIRHEDKLVAVNNGDPIMDRVIATGCAQGALIAGLCSVVSEPFHAALAGSLWFSIAGEVAAANSIGPGSFPVAFLDALHTISTDTIRNQARLS